MNTLIDTDSVIPLAEEQKEQKNLFPSIKLSISHPRSYMPNTPHVPNTPHAPPHVPDIPYTRKLIAHLFKEDPSLPIVYTIFSTFSKPLLFQDAPFLYESFNLYR